MINGGEGDDNIDNRSDNSSINGGSGNDKIWNLGRKVTIKGGTGNDSIKNNSYNATIDGGKGNDTIDNIYGSNSSISGGEGNDFIQNSGYEVTISGGKGNDTISNEQRNNVLFQYNAGDGNDKIYGFNNTSTLSISGGSYSIKESGDNIVVTVGKGKITLIGAAATLSSLNIKGINSSGLSLTTKKITNSTKSPVKLVDFIKVADASTRTKAVKITGNTLDNTITGTSKNDTIYGGDGNDLIYGNAGNDLLSGGKGNDSLSGGAGNDKLYGGAGNDTLWGGKGNDSLWGDAGKDIFLYCNGEDKDVIYGFDNNDMLLITGAFSASYNKSKKEIYFKVGSTSKAITLTDFSATSFNINGFDYKISGTKLVKQ